MRLILHAGTHKTGTTSIQSVLANSREWLRRRGLFYPGGMGVFSSDTPHHQFAHGLTGSDVNAFQKSVRFISEVREDARPDETVLLSAEPIWRHRDGVRKPGDYWERRSAYLSRLAETLSGFDVCVLIFLRDRTDFAASMEAESKMKGNWPGPEAFERHIARLSDYESHLECFRRHFPEVVSADYDEAKSGIGLIPTFFDLIGFPVPPGSEKVWVRKRGQPPPHRQKKRPGPRGALMRRLRRFGLHVRRE